MKKLAFLALATAAAAGCSSTEVRQDGVASAPDTTDGVTTTQLRAFADLQALTNRRWLWVQHDAFKTPMHLSAPRTGKGLLGKGIDPARTTIGLLSANRQLFKMRDPAVELTEKKTETDALGITHIRFQQLTHGVPVAGAELTAHYDAEGRIASIDANYVADLDGIDVQPAFTAADGASIVKDSIVTATALEGGAIAAASLDAEEGKLVVYAPAAVTAAPAKLAYQYTVHALAGKHPAIWVTTLDAKTGAVLHQYNNLQTIEGQGTGVLGDAKKLDVSADGINFVMTGAAGGVEIRTYTAEQVQTAPGAKVTSTNQNSWDTNVPGAGAAVDAHFNAEAVLKYYKNRFQRNAIDGAGGALVSTVHFGEAFDNAAWTGRGMIYGDGGTVFRALSVSLDVVAHEFTHGVTEKTSNLTYENQSGALNEAVSDIFGAFIEHAVAPDEAKNWSIGETIVKTGPPLRNLKTPGAVDQPQPSHMTKFVNTQQDNGGVHINSGIINNAAFLMTVGGVNPVSKVEVKYGIGWEKSEKLWYQANTKYFMATTNFGQAAQNLLQAAKDIGLSANETAIVECSLKATGIAQGACATLVDPKAITPPAVEVTTPGTGTPGTTDESPGDGAGEDEGEDTPVAAPKTRRRRVITQSEGCNASATSSRGSTLAPVGLLGILLGLAARRKKRD